MPAGWSGRPNGQIPLSMMTQLRSDIGVSGYAQADAARAYLAMAAAFQEAVGVPLGFSEAYRDFARQQYYRALYQAGKGSPAAIPGTSNHGEGLAFDFAYPLTSWTTQGQAWFRQNEARFGFSSAQGIADGEPWHKVYIGPTPTVAGGGATTIPNTTNRTDDDEMITPEGLSQLRTLVRAELLNATTVNLYRNPAGSIAIADVSKGFWREFKSLPDMATFQALGIYDPDEQLQQVDANTYHGIKQECIAAAEQFLRFAQTGK